MTSQEPTRAHQLWYQKTCGMGTQKHPGMPLLWLQSLGWTSQGRPLRTGHQGGETEKAGAWQAGPCPLMSMCRVPLSCPDSTADFELPLNHPQPQALPGGQLCPSVLADFPCMTGQVSDQPLLFCPRTIQRTARPHHLDSQEAPPWAPPQLNMTLTLPTAPTHRALQESGPAASYSLPTCQADPRSAGLLDQRQPQIHMQCTHVHTQKHRCTGRHRHACTHIDTHSHRCTHTQIGKHAFTHVCTDTYEHVCTRLSLDQGGNNGKTQRIYRNGTKGLWVNT